MRVGFYTAFSRDPIHYVLARGMIASVRASMPDIPIVQLTDESSPAVLGVDEVRRLPSENLCVITARHYSRCEGDWLLIDTDILVRRDVRHLFVGATWDIGITDRIGTEEGPIDPSFGPYNIGVVFQRSGKEFWSAVVAGLLELPEKDQKWMGNQTVACRLLKDRSWNVKILPGSQYNYPPRNPTEDYSHAAIVHFKGAKRKLWMWRMLNKGNLCASV